MSVPRGRLQQAVWERGSGVQEKKRGVCTPQAASTGGVGEW
ncbi:MAG: hypothetical protein ACI4EJ_00005 [Bacteroides sp.]